MNGCIDIHCLEKECRSAEANGILHGVVVVTGTQHTQTVSWAWGHSSVSPAKQVMQVDLVFDLASVTKAVATATACAICVDRGVLDPEAPASEYLPRLGQIDGGKMRVCDLATHCSGYDNRKFDKHGPAQLVTNAIETPAQWPPRERYEYSCRNFIVLGKIVEQVTGEDLATFCRENIFVPLGMSRTAFGPILTGLEHVVPTHQPAGTIADEQARTADGAIGNAGLFSNAADLVVFSQMMLGGGERGKVRILGDRGLAWLTRPCSPAGLPRRSFGWDMRPHPDCLHRPSILSPSAIGHSGWTGQSLWIDPDLGLYVIVMSNRTHAPRNKGADTHGSSEMFRKRMADIVLAHPAFGER